VRSRGVRHHIHLLGPGPRSPSRRPGRRPPAYPSSYARHGSEPWSPRNPPFRQKLKRFSRALQCRPQQRPRSRCLTRQELSRSPGSLWFRRVASHTPSPRPRERSGCDEPQRSRPEAARRIAYKDWATFNLSSFIHRPWPLSADAFEGSECFLASASKWFSGSSGPRSGGVTSARSSLARPNDPSTPTPDDLAISSRSSNAQRFPCRHSTGRRLGPFALRRRRPPGKRVAWRARAHRRESRRSHARELPANPAAARSQSSISSRARPLADRSQFLLATIEPCRSSATTARAFKVSEACARRFLAARRMIGRGCPRLLLHRGVSGRRTRPRTSGKSTSHLNPPRRRRPIVPSRLRAGGPSVKIIKNGQAGGLPREARHGSCTTRRNRVNADLLGSMKVRAARERAGSLRRNPRPSVAVNAPPSPYFVGSPSEYEIMKRRDATDRTTPALLGVNLPIIQRPMAAVQIMSSRSR